MLLLIYILSFWGHITFFKLTVNHVKDVICHQISLGLTAVVAESCVCGDLWMLLPCYPAKRDELNEERNESWMSRKRSRGLLPPCATTPGGHNKGRHINFLPFMFWARPEWKIDCFAFLCISNITNVIHSL